MVQNLSNQNSYGSVNRIGTTPDGRGLYQVTDGDGKQSLKLSVAQKDCDTFERSYNTIISVGPKLKAYVETSTPQQIEKKQKTAKWLIGGATFLGALWPMLKAKGASNIWGFLKQLGLTLLGAGVGFAGSTFCASKLLTPPGAKELTQASQALSKLDIKQA